MEPIKEKEKKAYEALKDKYHYKNEMSAPRLLKVVVSSGTGSGVKKSKDYTELVQDRLTKITGQLPVVKGARKSIAGFKIREGDPVGVMVTLRGQRMFGFLDKLVNVAIPRTKDFRGISQKSVDNMGNLTMSIKEHTIFPETGDEDLRDIFGLAITIVTSARTKEESLDFLSLVGIPFKK